MVTAVCYAVDGHRVWGVETDPTKISRLQAGFSSISEPGIDQLLEKALTNGHLTVTDDAREAIAATDIALICVGTPSNETSGTDLSFVLRVSNEIGMALRDTSKPYVVVLRSTVPPGTTRDHVLPALQTASGRSVGEGIDLYFNPEFLRQGSAIDDCRHPPFTVIGTSGGVPLRSSAPVCQLYRNIEAPLLALNFQEAELLKLACNAFHAVKIDFANEIGTLAQRLDADPGRVMNAFVLDNKLNASGAYLRPGFAFGGSCLPKDVRSLNYIAKQLGLDLPVHEVILRSNDAHLERLVADMAILNTRTIGMVGLAFKPNTDDLRESAALRLAKQLLKKGKDVLFHEPEVSVEGLIGANLEYLTEMMPDYRDRRLDWPTLRQRADIMLITREGIVPKDELSALTIPVLHLANLPAQRYTSNALTIN